MIDRCGAGRRTRPRGSNAIARAESPRARTVNITAVVDGRPSQRNSQPSPHRGCRTTRFSRYVVGGVIVDDRRGRRDRGAGWGPNDRPQPKVAKLDERSTGGTQRAEAVSRRTFLGRHVRIEQSHPVTAETPILLDHRGWLGRACACRLLLRHGASIVTGRHHDGHAAIVDPVEHRSTARSQHASVRRGRRCGATTRAVRRSSVDR